MNFKQFLTESTSVTVFIIKRNDGGYVDRDGRKTNTLKNAYMWSDKSKAETFLKGGARNMYLAPGATFKGYKVIPLTLTVAE